MFFENQVIMLVLFNCLVSIIRVLNYISVFYVFFFESILFQLIVLVMMSMNNLMNVIIVGLSVKVVFSSMVGMLVYSSSNSVKVFSIIFLLVLRWFILFSLLWVQFIVLGVDFSFGGESRQIIIGMISRYIRFGNSMYSVQVVYESCNVWLVVLVMQLIISGLGVVVVRNMVEVIGLV